VAEGPPHERDGVSDGGRDGGGDSVGRPRS